MDYCYRADFLLEGVSVEKESKKDNFMLVPEGSKDKAILKYSFCMQHLSEVGAEAKAKNDVNKFLSFLFLGINGGAGAYAFSTKFLKIECTNYMELVIAHQETPMFEHFNYSTTYGISDEALTIATDSFNKYSPTIKENYWVSLEFWRTGLSKNEEYSRFDDIWKSFEIFYRENTHATYINIEAARIWCSAVLNQGDMKNIVEQFTKIEDNEVGLKVKMEKYSSPFDCLIKKNYTSGRGTINYSQNLDAAIKTKEYAEATANLILCIDKLRNDIFHANIFSDNERPIIFIAAAILSEILNSAFHNILP